jgi:hypothetical protein
MNEKILDSYELKYNNNEYFMIIKNFDRSNRFLFLQKLKLKYSVKNIYTVYVNTKKKLYFQYGFLIRSI